ncbi:hypothetical protein EA187_10470 [Lujinxingia sediminis]|uniref:Porin n=1 Tax=Lujinxingia sediminis TaxID=2480984 RepID=A0ABY0CS90_9DELT|nr:porin [Lujinxingia sediminis]RVU43980.1 hypothetical protein EA187_10470 [Lujinxingia sediminis]
MCKKVFGIAAAALAAATFFVPGVALGQEVPDLSITSEDGDFSITFNGDFQLRYEVNAEDLSVQNAGFFIRRLRPAIEARAFGNLVMKVVPELNRGASLRDGWVAYEFSDHVIVQAGQFAPPFSWERDSSSDYHVFVERSLAHGEFQWADGRDIGVMVDADPSDTFHLEAGIFNGEGRNAMPSPDVSHVVTGRVAGAPIGVYSESEALVEPVAEPTLILGAGAYYANASRARDWLGDDSNLRAALLGATADAYLAIDRVTLQGSYFFRDTRSPDGAFDGFVGQGMNAQLAVLAVKQRLLLAARFSQTYFDDAAPVTSNDEAALAAQIYHRGHRSKLHVEVGARGLVNDGPRQEFLRLQYQFLF